MSHETQEYNGAEKRQEVSALSVKVLTCCLICSRSQTGLLRILYDPDTPIQFKPAHVLCYFCESKIPMEVSVNLSVIEVKVVEAICPNCKASNTLDSKMLKAQTWTCKTCNCAHYVSKHTIA